MSDWFVVGCVRDTGNGSEHHVGVNIKCNYEDRAKLIEEMT